jgi:hypothetical protein
MVTATAAALARMLMDAGACRRHRQPDCSTLQAAKSSEIFSAHEKNLGGNAKLGRVDRAARINHTFWGAWAIEVELRHP